jgi:hypothetical protein
MNLQDKIDACWRLANDPGATPEERETAKRFAEKLEAKLRGQGEAQASTGSFWDGDGDEWYTGQCGDIYEAVDEFLRNAKGRERGAVPIGIHIPSLDKQFVAMGRCEVAISTDVIRTAWGNMPGYTESNVTVEFRGRDAGRVEPLVRELFQEMLGDVLVVARRGDGMWLNSRGFIREAHSEYDMHRQPVMRMSFVATDFEISDHIVKPKPRELPARTRELPGPR